MAVSVNRRQLSVLLLVALCILGIYYHFTAGNKLGLELLSSSQQVGSVEIGNHVDYDYEDSLRSYLFAPKQCPPGRFLSVIPGGNLGNLVWEYMSLYVIAQLFGKKFNFKPYVNDNMKETIETTFQSLSIPATSTIPEDCVDLKDAKVIQLNQTFIFNPDDDSPLILGRYSARYEEVLHYGILRLKRELRFREDLKEIASTKLRIIKDYFQMESDNVTFVGVHYRGTDYYGHLSKIYDKTVDGASLYKYYIKAMTYFKSKYKNVIFILLSIDYDWLHQYAPYLTEQFNMTVNPNGDSRESDFVLLSHCNHSIINYGTFGVTTALFAEGTTFVYDLKLPLDHRGATVAMGIADILPDWHLLS